MTRQYIRFQGQILTYTCGLIRAVTLKETFAEAAKKEGVLSLTFEKLRAKGVSRKDIFEEIPITLQNSPLAAAMATSLEPEVLSSSYQILFWLL